MIKALKTRFSKPVFPGQTLQTDMWLENTRVYFRCKALESGDIVLTGGYVDLHTSAARAVSAPLATQGTNNASLKSNAIFEQLKSMISSAGAELVKQVRAIFLWNITVDGKTAAQWTVDLKTPPGALYEGEPQGARPGCTMTLSDEDFVLLATGDLNPQQAFFQGKIKITGNVMLSQKLQQLFNRYSKL